MAEPSRYNTDGNVENGVLKNKLGIINQKDLEDAETALYLDAYPHFSDLLHKHKLIFNAQLILDIHKYFLGPLYGWAGKMRLVDISKGSTMFCSVPFLYNAIKIL